jgi:DNA invertase Pin-like site-specific DNA recombinase
MAKYIIAEYIRLSIEDEKTESLSIPNQRMILDRHIDSLDIPNAEALTFIDNGHSGVNMERPAVQEMLDMVRSGGIQAIAVKDFSRFSRSALDSGYFIEQVFPLYGVRFISVSDNFDSNEYKNDTGGLDVAFKFLMHEYYSQDLSKKVKSAKRVQMKRGENIVASAIYGYMKADSGRWEPEPVSSGVVRRIFQMALAGQPLTQIRDTFCAERLPTPQEHIDLRRGKDILPLGVWTTRMILHMLTNEQYTGTYVAGKMEQKAVCSRSRFRVDKSDWIVIPDSHTPIIGKEDFAAVQEILSKHKGSRTAKPLANPLESGELTNRRSKMVSGESKVAVPIYGYVKTGDGLAIDEPAAEVVREMFALAAKGLAAREIAETLAARQTPKPNEYKKLAKGQCITPTCAWAEGNVKCIIYNIQYTGAYVVGKTLKNHETGRMYHVPQSDWVVIPDKNPAIVSTELYDKVQAIVAARRYKCKNMSNHDYLLRGGIIKCGCCGYAMSYDDIFDPVYRCHHTMGMPEAECHKHKANARKLDDAILTVIRKQAEIILNSGDFTELRKVSDSGKRIADFEKQAGKCIDERQRAYEQFVTHAIDRETYLALKEGCTELIERLNNQISVARQAERDRQSGVKAAALAKEILDEKLTPRELVETLIDKILVFPGDRLEIQWKIADFATA